MPSASPIFDPRAHHSIRTRLMAVPRAFLAHIPTFLGNFIADRTGDIVYVVAGKSRRAAINNLRHVLGPAPRPMLRKSVRQVFRNVMRNYYDLCRMPDMSDRKIAQLLDFDQCGWDRVVEFHRQRRGVILVTAHFGAFDVMTQVLSRRGLPVSAMIAQIKPAWLSDFVSDLRGKRDVSLLLVNEEEGSGLNLAALKQTIILLREGGVLATLVDRNMEQRGEHIRFFGYDTVVASGIAKLALRTRSVIMPGFCKRLPNNRYSLVFDEPIEPVGYASEDNDIKKLLSQIFARMEHHIGNNPEQWVLLQPVWPK